MSTKRTRMAKASVSMPPQTLAAGRKLAARDDRSFSSFVARLIRDEQARTHQQKTR